MTWAPSKVRDTILAAHEVLRRKLDEIERLLTQVARGEKAVEATLSAALQDFHSSLLEHMKHEEAVLRPLLGRIDAWGPERVERMDADHTAQRQTLEELRVMLSKRSPSECSAPLLRFVDDVRADMELEERESLSEVLLKDDPVTTEPSA